MLNVIPKKLYSWIGLLKVVIYQKDSDTLLGKIRVEIKNCFNAISDDYPKQTEFFIVEISCDFDSHKVFYYSETLENALTEYPYLFEPFLKEIEGKKITWANKQKF